MIQDLNRGLGEQRIQELSEWRIERANKCSDPVVLSYLLVMKMGYHGSSPNAISKFENLQM